MAMALWRRYFVRPLPEAHCSNLREMLLLLGWPDHNRAVT